MPSTGRNPTSNCLPRRWSCTGYSGRTARTKRSTKRFMDSLKASVLTAFYTPHGDNRHHRGRAGRLQRPPRRMLGTVGRCRRVRGFHAAAQPQCGCDGFREGSAHGYNLEASLSRPEKCAPAVLRKSKDRSTIISTWRCPTFRSVTLPCSTRSFSGATLSARRSAQKTIHNYFFLKGLDAVRDGGIVAFITSQGGIE